MTEDMYYYGTGRRKRAVARVRLAAGKGSISVDGEPLEERFPHPIQQLTINRPLVVTGMLGKFDVMVKVTGGGVSGQVGAISHGIARALVQADQTLKSLLRKYGLLTRDSREKERKKYGLVRARKAKQYTKR